ncbi:MAG: Glycerol-3-phosphate acyltransferase [Labilithrix sp.]|nr:Glycerol-3-phosphate acyltransferase [Labilithrix sp.]
MLDLKSYVPNPALAWIYQRFFEHIEVDEAWAGKVREAEARGTVLYVLRNLSFVDFLALDYLTKRLHLPQVRFANDLGLWVLEPMGRGWLQALRPRRESDDSRRLRTAIDGGHSAALFLKRPPSLLDGPPAVRQKGGTVTALPTRGKAEGDAYLRAVLEAQRERKTPILLVPQVFVWSRTPDDKKHNAVDALFGPREWPGKIRTVVQFLANYRHVTLRAGEPVDVQAFLQQETHPSDEDGPRSVPTDDVLVRRLTYVLLRRLERERRGVLGPAKKPHDRLREQVVRSPRLQKVIRDMAGQGEAERRVLGYRAISMLRELEAEVDPNAIRALDALIDQTIARMYSGFEFDEAGLARAREAAKDGTLVLLPSHKSHVDYIILSRMFHRANMAIPLVAAGDNLSFFPLGPVLRRAGAFFIRRSFKGDRLYGAVVDAYMRRLLKDGHTLEFFLEGGRSRTGKLLPPKLGLLSIVVDAVLGGGEGGDGAERKVYFCPISIGYERLVEEKSYVHELSGGEKQKEDVGGLLRAAESALGRYGRLNVQFGELLTLDGVLGELGETKRPTTPAKRRALVTRLAYRAMNEINRVTAVTPSALVAAALLTHDQRGLPHAELVSACERLARMLRAEGARFTPSLATTGVEGDVTIRRGAIREACELLARAGHIEAHRPGTPITDRDRQAKPGPDAIYVVPDVARISLDIAKNLVVHFFLSGAMIAATLHAAARAGEASLATEHLAERVQSLSRLFKYEFQFRADATFETIFSETLAAMAGRGEVAIDGDHVALPPEGEGRERLRLQARMVRNFVEGYRVAARSLSVLLKGPLAPKDLAKRAIAVGERMFLAGELTCREAVNRPVLENAFLAFVDQGYLGRIDGKYVLPESYATAAEVGVIEARVAAYIG